MSIRLRLAIILIGIVLVIAGIVYVVIINTKKRGLPTDTPNTPQTGQVIDSSTFTTNSLAAITGSGANPVPTTTQPITNPIELEKLGVERLASVFAARYGSFSSDNSYQNVREVEQLATRALWAKIRPPSSPRPAATFSGVTTEVLMTKLTTWADAAATVEVTASRTETTLATGVPSTTVYQQKATINLVKQGTNWLVDSFTWLKP